LTIRPPPRQGQGPPRWILSLPRSVAPLELQSSVNLSFQISYCSHPCFLFLPFKGSSAVLPPFPLNRSPPRRTLFFSMQDRGPSIGLGSCETPRKSPTSLALPPFQNKWRLKTLPTFFFWKTFSTGDSMLHCWASLFTSIAVYFSPPSPSAKELLDFLPPFFRWVGRPPPEWELRVFRTFCRRTCPPRPPPQPSWFMFLFTSNSSPLIQAQLLFALLVAVTFL